MSDGVEKQTQVRFEYLRACRQLEIVVTDYRSGVAIEANRALVPLANLHELENLPRISALTAALREIARGAADPAEVARRALEGR